MLRGHIFDANEQNVCRTADFQTLKKLCESNNFIIM